MANMYTPMKPKEEARPGNPGQFVDEMKNKAQETATSVTEKAKDFAGGVADKAKEAASSAAQSAGEAASTVGHKAEDATAAVACGMKSLAGSIREHTPQGGVLGTASSTIAETLESGSRYLQEEGLKGIGEDLTNVIRRNPLPALFVGIGLGYLIARATRS